MNNIFGVIFIGIASLLQVTIDDAEAADRIFEILMGNQVPPRKKFIQTHARNVINLDL